MGATMVENIRPDLSTLLGYDGEADIIFIEA